MKLDGCGHRLSKLPRHCRFDRAICSHLSASLNIARSIWMGTCTWQPSGIGQTEPRTHCLVEGLHAAMETLQSRRSGGLDMAKGRRCLEFGVLRVTWLLRGEGVQAMDAKRLWNSTRIKMHKDPPISGRKFISCSKPPSSIQSSKNSLEWISSQCMGPLPLLFIAFSIPLCNHLISPQLRLLFVLKTS